MRKKGISVHEIPEKKLATHGLTHDVMFKIVE